MENCEQKKEIAFRDELERLGKNTDAIKRENAVMRRQLDMVEGLIEMYRSGRSGSCMSDGNTVGQGLLMRYDAALKSVAEAKK